MRFRWAGPFSDQRRCGALLGTAAVAQLHCKHPQRRKVGHEGCQVTLGDVADELVRQRPSRVFHVQEVASKDDVEYGDYNDTGDRIVS